MMYLKGEVLMLTLKNFIFLSGETLFSKYFTYNGLWPSVGLKQ